MASKRLVDTQAAEQWTGRPAGTLYRWLHERRVTPYGTSTRRLWDIDELPRYVHLCTPRCLAGAGCPPLPEPPPARPVRLPEQRSDGA